jgi:hypothetical protein
MMNGRKKKLTGGAGGRAQARAVVNAAVDRVSAIENPQVRAAAQQRLRNYVQAKAGSSTGRAVAPISQGTGESVRGGTGRRGFTPDWS